MPAVQIRDLDQSTYDVLKACAKANGRSINQQLKVIVTEHFAVETTPEPIPQPKPTATVDDVFAPACNSPRNETHAQRAQRRSQLFESLASMNLGALCPSVDNEAMVREMRDAR